MIYLLDALICFALIIFQTVILPLVPFLACFYDLMIPFVVYLAVFRKFRSSIVFLLFLGFVMDSLSGTPFGLYISAYLWLFLIMRGITKILHLSRNMLWPSLMLVGTIIENLIFYGVIIILGHGIYFSSGMVKDIALQLIWAGLTGPFLLIVIHTAHIKWEALTKILFQENKSLGMDSSDSR